MFRLRFISPFKFTNSLLFKRNGKFSTENKPPENKPIDPMPQESNKSAEIQTKYHQRTSAPVNPPRYQQDAGKSFVDKLNRIEEAQRFGGGTKRDARSFLIPGLLCLTSIFLYHCWMTVPYSTIYK